MDIVFYRHTNHEFDTTLAEDERTRNQNTERRASYPASLVRCFFLFFLFFFLPSGCFDAAAAEIHTIDRPRNTTSFTPRRLTGWRSTRRVKKSFSSTERRENS